MKWIKFAESVPADSKACFDIFIKLNEELAQKSVLLGNGFRISEADVIVFSALHSFVVCISHLILFFSSFVLVCFSCFSRNLVKTMSYSSYFEFLFKEFHICLSWEEGIFWDIRLLWWKGPFHLVQWLKDVGKNCYSKFGIIFKF